MNGEVKLWVPRNESSTFIDTFLRRDIFGGGSNLASHKYAELFINQLEELNPIKISHETTADETKTSDLILIYSPARSRIVIIPPINVFSLLRRCSPLTALIREL